MPISKLETLFLVCCGGLAMAASDSSSGSRKLDQTPTWAVAVVCTFFILVSIALEKSFHKLGTWFGEKPKKALLEALGKLKAELMILGFISLLLTFGQSYIVRICISSKLADTMLPCSNAGTSDSSSSEEEHRRKLLFYERRYLSADSSSSKCKTGHEPLVSVDGLHQLHLLIFFLAVVHVFYSAITMLLGKLKIRGWKEWEEETSSHDYEFSNDPARFRLTHQTSFVRLHANIWARFSIFFCISCFVRQFYKSVGKTDYQTVRNGFIAVHLSPGSKFNFQKYIKRTLEDDFKVVVGVSPVLWASFVCFLILTVSGWHTLLWASLIPPLIILAIGTKLQMTLSRMANDIKEKHAVVQGIPLVQGSDEYFWFGRPELAILKLIIGILVLCLCSYITLPLYALVSQMGSRLKKSIFDEQTKKALKKWRDAVKKKKQAELRKSPIRNVGGGTAASAKPSSGPSLRRFQTTGHSTRSTTTFAVDENGADLEAEPSSSTDDVTIEVDHDDEQQSEENEPHIAEETPKEGDFAFVKSEPLEAKRPEI